MKKTIFYNILLLLILVIVFEIGLKLTGNNSLTFEERLETSLIYEGDSTIGFKLKPNQTIFDQNKGNIKKDRIKFIIGRDGFRNENLRLVDVIFIGGSHVFDVKVFNYNLNNGFVSEIAKAFPKVGFLNAAVPGYDLFEIKQSLSKLIENHHPKVVVFSSLWNDYKWMGTQNPDSCFSKKFLPSRNPLIYPQNTLDNCLGFSILYRKIRDYYWKNKLGLSTNSNVLESVSSAKKSSNMDVSRYILHFNEIANMLKSKNIKLVILQEHSLISKNTPDSMKTKINFGYVNKATFKELLSVSDSIKYYFKSLQRSEHISYLYYPQIEGNSDYFEDHVHLKDRGSRKLALEITLDKQWIRLMDSISPKNLDKLQYNSKE